MVLLPVLGTRGHIHGVWYQFSYRLAQKSKKNTQTMVQNTLVLSRGVPRDYAPQLVPKTIYVLVKDRGLSGLYPQLVPKPVTCACPQLVLKPATCACQACTPNWYQKTIYVSHTRQKLVPKTHIRVSESPKLVPIPATCAY